MLCQTHNDGLVQKRHNSVDNTLELPPSCTNPSIYHVTVNSTVVTEINHRFYTQITHIKSYVVAMERDFQKTDHVTMALHCTWFFFHQLNYEFITHWSHAPQMKQLPATVNKFLQTTMWYTGISVSKYLQVHLKKKPQACKINKPNGT